jgi:hypothetical protein
MRWAYQGGMEADPDALERLRVERRAACARLATVIADDLPVVGQREVAR